MSAGYFQRALEGESEMIRTHMGKYNRSVSIGCSVWKSCKFKLTADGLYDKLD
jgi:hypothetical protein